MFLLSKERKRENKKTTLKNALKPDYILRNSNENWTENEVAKVPWA